MKIREAVASDAEACGRVMHRAFRGIAEAHGFPPDIPSDEMGSGLAAALIASPTVYAYVAEQDGRVVGSNFVFDGDAIRSDQGGRQAAAHLIGWNVGWKPVCLRNAPERAVHDATTGFGVRRDSLVNFHVVLPCRARLRATALRHAASRLLSTLSTVSAAADQH